jgi:murein DD-endopeptidase MepM/ murein hydrolase activator NlpD
VFTDRIKDIFLSNDNEQNNETFTTSQNLNLFKSGEIENTSANAESGDASSSDSLQATYGSLRFSTEELDIPINDAISLYEVKKGDTLSTVAKLFGVSKNTIMWANDLKSQNISPGDTLVILPMTGIKHTIKKGDTVYTIAKKYKADAEDIAKFNGITKDTDLTVGEVVLVPEGEITIIQQPSKSIGTQTSGQSKLNRSYSYSTPNGFLIRPVIGGRKTQRLHGNNGIDIGATSGTPVLASAGGQVIVAKTGGYNGGYGNFIIISHEGNIQTVYAHLKAVYVHPGQSVSQGQVIGGIGSTGNSTGSHLHFEVRGAKNPF